ncbi:hypothetical protein HO173_012039 [Letharia columbiana]|uniref:Uncharacterized protein n=1 Tax=Letharia columbiana TaxID=112416 RepID=A0A8H6CQN0_9LECA|nr:uncharacterized protein HO173_012039 [Letharia columbiana]KAF6227709.1 hypothetical protein HO173_012039 [Letharia columbiana]
MSSDVAPPYNGSPLKHPNNPCCYEETFSPDRHNGPDCNGPQTDPTDTEMLAEAPQHAQHNPPNEESDHHEQAALDESLSWIANANRQKHAGVHAPLALPVVIPQTAPGMQSSFSRAWAPILAEHDVRPEDFLQFMDHLNVCKAASPPFQVLNLAGTVLGCTPIPFAGLVGLGTSVAAGAGTYATARIRITRYLEQANQEYFAPRGLLARIAKQNVLPQIVGQPENAPLLAPLPRHASKSNGSITPPSLRDRRLQALGSHIARIEFCDLPTPQEEHNMLDKLSAKMTARKTKKQEEKIVKDSMKSQEEESKKKEKLMKEEAKIRQKMEKARFKGSGNEAKMEGKMMEVREKYDEKAGEGGEKEMKAAKKFLFVVVQNAQAAAAADS